MARLDAGLTQGLMNPTYQKELGQVGGMLGGLGGHMRKTRRDKEEAQNMAGMTTEGLLARQRELASTPAEAITSGLAQQQEKLAETQRKDAEREKKQGKAEKLAASRLSAMGVRHKALVKAGEQEKADELLGQMEEIAGGAMVKLSDYVEDVDSSGRYMNIGDGIVFDTYTGEAIDNKTGEKVDLNTLDPKDLDASYYRNREAYTPESWSLYSDEMATSGDPVLAGKKLKRVNVAKEAADVSASKVTDATRVIANIDEMLSLSPESAMGAVGQAAFKGVPWTDYQALETKANSLRANTAFDSLQKMRDNSKTGGALGAISEKELGLLQDTLAALEPTSKTFRQDLEVIRRAYQRIIDIEMGPDGGGPNYQTGPDGRVFYRDATSGIVYDYATGNPVPKRG